MNRLSLQGGAALIAALLPLVASAQAPMPPNATAPLKAAGPPKATAPVPAAKLPKSPPPVTSLDVTVTDPSGKPLEGAIVTALPVQGAYRPFGGLATEKIRSTLTGKDGKAKLESLPPGPWNVIVYARGFVRQPLQRVASGPLAVRLEKGGSITGVVREGRTSRPVPGARVSVRAGIPGTGGWEDEATRNESAADAQGRFRLDGIGRTAASVVVRAPGFGQAEKTAREGDSVEVFLFPGATLAGTVRALPPAALGIGVSAPRHATRRVEATPTRRGAVDLGDVVLETGLAIRGRVRDREGNGLEGASVRARLRRPGERRLGEATSEADGEFVVAGLEAGTYRITAALPGYASAFATALAGGEPVDLVMAPGGEIAGRVVDASGQPAEEATVEAEWAGDAEAAPPGGFGIAEEGEGRFVLRDLAAGRYVVQARAAGKGETSTSGVRVVAGKRTEVGALRLAAGGIVRGTVADVDGRGVPGARVVAERDLMMQTGDLEAQTGSSGTFEIRGVPVGRVSVMVSHPAYAPPKPEVVEVDPEKELVPVRIVLLEGARVEGRAAHRDGRPFASGRIMVSSLAPGAEGIGEVPSPVRADGSFVVDHVTAGRTRVELLAPSSPGGLTGLLSREVLLTDGETTTVDFALRDVVVAGTVTRAGQPTPGVRVSLRSLEGAPMTLYTGVGASGVEARGGPPSLVATSREDGAYELVVFTPGRTQVRLEAVSGSERYPDREVVVPDADRFELDLEIAAAQVSGTVVDKDGGEPVPDARVRLGRASASTGPDGRFALAAEPGEQHLAATAPGRRLATLTLNVGREGLSDVRVEMERGLEVRGRVVDGAGRPAPNLEVAASDVSQVYAATVWTLGDGSFLFAGLNDEPYTLASGSDLAGWAVRGTVAPGSDPVTLTLRPGGRIAVRVRGANGRPVKDAYPSVQRVDGVPVSLPGGSAGTDANGLVEISAPAGLVEIEASTREGMGRASVSVAAGAILPLEVVLQAPKGP